MLGEGFNIPSIHTGLEDAELDHQIWEMGLFDDTAAQELVTYLGSQQGVAPIYLNRLLFRLRFSKVSFTFSVPLIIRLSAPSEEGKQCIRNVPDWQDQLMNLIHNHDCALIVRLVTIVAYYEACESPVSNMCVDAKKSFSAILAAHNHQDGSRVVALLRPLTRHQIL